MSNRIKKIDISEFRTSGFLQEANRLFFHPRGLALEVVLNDDGTESLGGIWDSRNDPEGIAYGEAPCPEKAALVEGQRECHANARRALFGDAIQPVGVRVQLTSNKP